MRSVSQPSKPSRSPARALSLLLVLGLLLILRPAGAATLASIQNDINYIINNANSSVQWSVLIENQWGTQTYYSLNPDTPRRPASNTKVFTTAGAFGLLGPTYTWRGYQLQSSSTSSPVEGTLADSDNTLADELFGLTGGSGSAIINNIAGLGINMTGAQMYDGSGLNYDNRFTSRQTLQLVRFMTTNYTYSQWATHLAISCVKGTLASRICGTATSGRVHAKTGTLTNGQTLSLSGYIDNTYDSQRYYFSIYCNSVPSTYQSDTRSRIDSIVTVMSTSGIPNPGPALGGIIVDNGGSGYSESGSWGSSVSAGYYGSGSRYASAVNGTNTATWTPTIATRGYYDVYVWYVAGGNRTPAASYQVSHIGGTTLLYGNDNGDGIINGINQQVNGSQWVKLGNWEFDTGTSGNVLLDSVNSFNGGDPAAVVSADAAQFVLTQATTPEYIVDNTDSGFSASSNWFPSTSVSGYYGTNYHARSTASASDSAAWNVDLNSSGSYEVFARWTTGTNRATAAPYIVYHDGGSTTIYANQQQNNGAWMSLGTYNFTAGDTVRVRLSCWTGSGSFVIADAIKMVKQ